MDKSKPKLYYFESYGRASAITLAISQGKIERADPLRLVLHYAKLDFDDILLTQEKFNELKSQGLFPYGQVPILEWDGRTYSQSRSIMRYLCQTLGYFPTDPEEVYRTESIGDFYVDIIEQVIRASASQRQEKSNPEYAKLVQDVLLPRMKILESRFLEYSKGKEYFVGEKISLADFYVVNLYFGLGQPELKEYTGGMWESTPELRKYVEARVGEFKSYEKNVLGRD